MFDRVAFFYVLRSLCPKFKASRVTMDTNLAWRTKLASSAPAYKQNGACQATVKASISLDFVLNNYVSLQSFTLLAKKKWSRMLRS